MAIVKGELKQGSSVLYPRTSTDMVDDFGEFEKRVESLAANSLKYKKISTKITLSASSEKIINLKDYISDLNNIISFSIKLGTWYLPYYENGVAKTFVKTISGTTMTIRNDSTQWSNYSLEMCIIYI